VVVAVVQAQGRLRHPIVGFILSQSFSEPLISDFGTVSLFDAEDKECIARRSAPEGSVTGGHVDHSIHDRGAGSVDTASASGNAVDGLVILLGVVLPDNAAIVDAVGSHCSVRRAGENDAGDHGDRGGLRLHALRIAIVAIGARNRRWTREPHALAGLNFHRSETPGRSEK